MFTKSLALLLLPALAVAQVYGPPPGPATPASGSSSSSTSSTLAVAPTAPASTANQINVNVAFNETFTYNPSNFSANVGTLVTFYFPNFGLNHSVTQGFFGSPCVPLTANSSTNSSAGFDSGLQAGATFTINITDMNPIYFFCKHPLHCGSGMVGGINAGANYTTYLNAAMALGANEQTITDNGPVVAGVDASATGPPVSDITGSGAAASTTTASGAMKVTTSIGFGLFAVVAIAVAMA